MKINIYIVVAVAVLVCFLLGGYYYGKEQYKNGYNAGYTHALESMSVPIEVVQKPDTATVQTGVVTTVEATVKPKPTPTTPDVVITTEAPKVSASVNGKEYTFDAKSEYLQAGAKTSASISVKIPERRWTIGLGTDGRKASYMLKAPIKGAVGLWIAGSGREKIMGGVSVSF